MNTSALCTQCGQKPPIVQREGGHLLCVDCNLKFVQALKIQQEDLARTLNHLYGMIEARLGMPNLYPRIETPQTIVHSSAMTFNNIKVDRSVVGAINTGSVTTLDVVVGQIRESGGEELANELKTLTEAILSSQLADVQKTEALEKLAFIGEQAAIPKEVRKKSVGRDIVSSLGKIVALAADLATLWTVVGPHLSSLF